MTTLSGTTGASTTTRDVPVRRIALEPAFASVPRHFAADGDLITSHFIAALSALFPEGENFFIRSVKHYRDQVTDPGLKEQVSGFIGQEVVHGREHGAFNEHLATLGYPALKIDRLVRKGMQFRSRHVAPIANLASTAALEHFTATLAELVMTSEETREAMGHDAVRDLFLWHALEESEHKAVAFDVYRAAGGTERRRIWTMRAITVSFLLGVIAHTTASLLGDRATYHPTRLARSVAALRHSPFLTRSVRRRIIAYNRVGFHPDDNDNTALLERWTAELFGTGGSLADHLR
jgi:uncharacterized protein